MLGLIWKGISVSGWTPYLQMSVLGKPASQSQQNCCTLANTLRNIAPATNSFEFQSSAKQKILESIFEKLILLTFEKLIKSQLQLSLGHKCLSLCVMPVIKLNYVMVLNDLKLL